MLESAPRFANQLFLSVELPEHVVAELGPTPSHAINGAEIWWIAKALETWGATLRGRSVLCFGDNAAAISGCVSGYSASVYVARLVGAVHHLLCQYDIACWFEWVHTKSNPLDGASREQWRAELAQLGAEVVDVEPRLNTDYTAFHPAPRAAR